MKLGAFSVSLSVKDLKASQQFYETLGFVQFAVHGMFENDILTFNPGWDSDAKTLESYDDVRVIQKGLKEKGIALETETDENTTGPASIVLKDPDGNTILIDQHV